MLKKSIGDLKEDIKPFSEFYELDLSAEIELWYNTWKDKQLSEEAMKNLEMCDVITEASTFFPAVSHTLEILLALPCTTCTVERLFSTLRRVKTWLRSTMGENRLNGKV